jgi:hypothetical protein
MKKIFYLILIIFLFAGCDKNEDKNDNGSGKLEFNMMYNCTGQKKSFNNKDLFIKAKSDTLYTQFGDYITSITPAVFIGKFDDMRLLSWDEGIASCIGLPIINCNNYDLASPSRLAYFSNNATVDFIPEVANLPTNNDIEFNLFSFSPFYYYQEFELPAQYDSIADEVMSLNYFCSSGSGEMSFDNHFIGGERIGRTIKGSSHPLMAPIFDSTWTGLNWDFSKIPHNYIFGSTDSSYIYYADGQLSINNPMAQGGYIIRSNAYNTITLLDIPYGETVTVSGTMSFNINNLIQIYAGDDNIPYTIDDIFVYAPHFWERLSVSIITN